ncbi:MAG TPA: ABC transporter permease [Polyangiaceae bacterium]|jgi:ABC-type dipeptide/oligopeptide/nickel transport system permease component|nr:ABC transporter permease [Polyangiaceae bacterium]
MLSILLRRLLWTIPTLGAVSIVTFLVLSYVPDASERGPRPHATDAETAARYRRERFLDLPRFVNTTPHDARLLALIAVGRVAKGEPDADQAARELVRLGGAALPHVLPSLGDLPGEERTRVALALAPIARRMGLARADDAASPELAVGYWTQFWADRSVEFKKAGVRTAIARLVRYRSASRVHELEELDTFVIPAVMERLAPPTSDGDIEVSRTLVEVLAHTTERDDRIAAGATLAEARAVVSKWRSWWLVYETDFITLDGATLVSAMVRETRYGKWAAGAALDLAGVTDGTERTYARIGRAAPTTAVLVFGGIGLGYALAVALGTFAAAMKRRTLDIGLGAVVVALHALPAAALAIAASRFAGTSLVVPTLVVAIGLVAGPARHQKSALVNVLEKDYVKATRARGASILRVVVRHGLRHALFSIATLFTVEPPIALGAAFVVEAVFGLDGLGRLTVHAVETRDTSFLMGLALALALAASLLVFLADLLYGALDPRLRGKVVGADA